MISLPLNEEWAMLFQKNEPLLNLILVRKSSKLTDRNGVKQRRLELSHAVRLDKQCAVWSGLSRLIGLSWWWATSWRCANTGGQQDHIWPSCHWRLPQEAQEISNVKQKLLSSRRQSNVSSLEPQEAIHRKVWFKQLLGVTLSGRCKEVLLVSD